MCDRESEDSRGGSQAEDVRREIRLVRLQGQYRRVSWKICNGESGLRRAVTLVGNRNRVEGGRSEATI